MSTPKFKSQFPLTDVVQGVQPEQAGSAEWDADQHGVRHQGPAAGEEVQGAEHGNYLRVRFSQAAQARAEHRLGGLG